MQILFVEARALADGRVGDDAVDEVGLEVAEAADAARLEPELAGQRARREQRVATALHKTALVSRRRWSFDL